MKEYKSKEGGRHLYNDDMHNLQDLALSVTEMFKNSGQSFVINGCNVTTVNSAGGAITTVTEGYVWLGNKIRKVEQRVMTGITFPIHIVAVDTTGPQLTYADNTTGEGAEEYTEYKGVVKTNTETISGSTISTDSSNQFPSLRTAFFNQYSLVKSVTTEQQITSPSRFTGTIYMTQPFVYNTNNQQSPTKFSVDANGNFIITLGNEVNAYRLVFEKSTGILSLRNSASNIIWKIGVGTTMSSGLNNPAIPALLQSEPTSSTLTYTDENGIIQNFRQGQMAMVGSGNATKFFILRGITSGTAYWSRVTTEDDPDYEAYMVHK
jgi:hypothetical protein